MSAGFLLQDSAVQVHGPNQPTVAPQPAASLEPQPVAPLASALQAILPSDLPEASRVDPTDVLAMTLDLAGSMRIDAHLSSEANLPRHDTVSSEKSRNAEAPRQLEQDLLGRFRLLEAPVLRRLHELPSGRSRIWDADRVHAELVSRGGFEGRGNRSGRAIRRVAQSACESYLVIVAGCLDRIRGEVRALRTEMGPDIAALGPRAAQIEAFDSLIAHARSRFSSQLFLRIAPSLAGRFEEQFVAAAQDLPVSPGVESLEQWYSAGGWVVDYQELAVRLVAAVLQYEWEGLLGLVRAAAEEESATGLVPDPAPGRAQQDLHEYSGPERRGGMQS